MKVTTALSNRDMKKIIPAKQKKETNRNERGIHITD